MTARYLTTGSHKSQAQYEKTGRIYYTKIEIQKMLCKVINIAHNATVTNAYGRNEIYA